MSIVSKKLHCKQEASNCKQKRRIRKEFSCRSGVPGFCKFLVGTPWPLLQGVILGPSGPKWQNEFEASSRGLSAPEVPIVQNQRSAEGASEKGPRQKTSKIVKNILDSFRHFSRRAKNVKHRQNVSRISSTLFDKFRAAPVFRPLLGGYDRTVSKTIQNRLFFNYFDSFAALLGLLAPPPPLGTHFGPFLLLWA